MSYLGPERRKKNQAAHDVEPVFLEKKFADTIDGIELCEFQVGDRLCLSRDEARLLMAEGWASPAPAHKRRKTPDISC